MKNYPGGNALIALKILNNVINLSSAVVIIIATSRVDILWSIIIVKEKKERNE